MGLGAPKMPKMPIWPVFEGYGGISDDVGGVCERQNILYLEFAYFGTQRTHLQNYGFRGKTLYVKMNFYEQKMTI